MRRVAALVLILSLVIVARHAGGDGGGRFATMALGIVLIVAALAGQALEHVGLPRLTGYLLVGVALGPSGADLVTSGMTSQLRLVNGLAVALIGFAAGMELDTAKLRGRWDSIVRHSGILIGLLAGGLFLGTLAATPWLSFTAPLSWSGRVAVAIVTASVMVTFSPTVAMAVLAETRARGPLSERVLQLCVVADLGVVFLFTGATALAQVLGGESVKASRVALHVSWEVVGSVLAGAAIGLGFAAYRHFVNQRTGLVLAGMCLVAAEVGQRVGLSPLLCCLAAGFVTRNVGRSALTDMTKLIEGVTLPIIVVFFAAAGASLHLTEIAAVAPMAVGLVVLRAGLIVSANRYAARKAAVAPEIARLIPAGLLSQAGISLGLAVIVGRDFAGWGSVLETLFVAVISVHELIGPILFRWALVRAQEVPLAEEDSLILQPVGITSDA